MESVDSIYLVGLNEFHATMRAIAARPLIVRHTNGSWYINGKPNDNYAWRDGRGDNDPYDWPEIVAGIISVTGWTYSRMDTELGLSHGQSKAYGTGQYSPRRDDIREKLLDMAHACGVKADSCSMQTFTSRADR
jgi:hypothetical protein